jgi:hypothetical protein
VLTWYCCGQLLKCFSPLQVILWRIHFWCCGLCTRRVILWYSSSMLQDQLVNFYRMQIFIQVWYVCFSLQTCFVICSTDFKIICFFLNHWCHSHVLRKRNMSMPVYPLLHCHWNLLYSVGLRVWIFYCCMLTVLNSRLPQQLSYISYYPSVLEPVLLSQ